MVFFSFFNSIRETYWKLFGAGSNDGNDEDSNEGGSGSRKTTSNTKKDFVTEIEEKWSNFRIIDNLAGGRIDKWEYVLSLNTIFVYNLLLWKVEEAEAQKNSG